MIDWRCVFDTDVILSAMLIEGSIPWQAFRRGLLQGKVLISEDTVSELKTRIMQSKFDRYVSRRQRLRLPGKLVRLGEPVVISHFITACRDPSDDRFVELAVNGHADCIVSGDSDLLELHPFRGISILSPRDFLNWRL